MTSIKEVTALELKWCCRHFEGLYQVLSGLHSASFYPIDSEINLYWLDETSL